MLSLFPQLKWAGYFPVLLIVFLSKDLTAQDSLHRSVQKTASVSDYHNKISPDYHITSIAEFLQGRVSGLKVTPYTGQPGTAAVLDIRGITSISGNNYPLFVIDGQVLNTSPDYTAAGHQARPADILGGMNLHDIETIEVFKDALTTGIYGAMGGNGVIKITTKSGKGPGKITYHNRMDMASQPKRLTVLNSGDYMQYMNEARQNSGESPLYTEEQLQDLSKASINWQDRVFKNSLSQSHYLSLSGRSEKSNYYISGNYSGQNGASYTDYTVGGLRINAEHTIASKLKLSLHSYYSNTYRTHAGDVPAATAGESNFAPLFALVNNPLLQDSADPADPLIFHLKENGQDLNMLMGNINASYRFNKSWAYTLQAGTSRYNAERETKRGGAIVRDRNKNKSFNLFSELTYHKSQDEHTLDASVLYSRYKRRKQTFNRSGLNSLPAFDLNSDFFRPSYTQYSMRETGLHSFKARLGYNYDSRYSLTLAGTYEGSSQYAPGSNWKLFPSAAGSWTISNEKNFNQQVISLLRIRSGYGISGTEHLISIGASDIVPYSYYPFGVSIDPGYVNYGYENLKHPVVKNFNVGTDISFAANKFNFSFDYYKKDIIDLKMNLSVPGGSSFYQENMGKISNTGFDFSGNYILIKRNWQLQVGSNVSFMKNKLSLPAGISFAGQSYAFNQSTYSPPVQLARSGFPVSSFWTYRTNGIYQTAEEAAAGPEAGSAKPGDIKWVDTNKDGKITNADKTVTGDPYPDLIFGLNADINYKKFSLNMGITGSSGNELINLNKQATHTNNAYKGYNISQEAYIQRWTGPGTSNLYPRPVYRTVPPIDQRIADWMVEDASFFRLQYIAAGYTFDLSSGSKIRKLRIYLSGTNLLTITNYSGYDPDIDTFGDNIISRGVDFGTQPRPRTISAGLELNL